MPRQPKRAQVGRKTRAPASTLLDRYFGLSEQGTDVRVVSALGCRPVGVVTALTVQNTTGVVDTEAMNADNELYGRQRMFSVLKASNSATDAMQLVNAVRDDVRAFVSNTERSDDLTILALRWRGGT